MNMKSAVVLALAATAAAVVMIPISKGTPETSSVAKRHPALSKRASFAEQLANNISGGGYYASVNIGTPGQAFNMVLDTGSSDAWITADGANLCTSMRLQSQYGPCGDTFDASASSTYQVLIENGFEITYLDGSTASGDYISDQLEIGGATVNALQMGLATQTVIGTSVLGIGFTANEAADVPYPNLVDSMVNQGLIAQRAYSLYLNDLSSSTGSILFGGMDTDKFIDRLSTIPILPDAQSNDLTSFTVGMTALSFDFSNGTGFEANLAGQNLKAVFDSGTTLSYLPDDVAGPFFEALGAVSVIEPDNTVFTVVDCGLRDSSPGLSFTFRFNDSVSIIVPVDELLLDTIDDSVYQIAAGLPFADTCLFGIQNSGGFLSHGQAQQIEFALLGDTFLRSAYVVYDLENLSIGLAQANLNSTESNFVDFTSNQIDLDQYMGVSNQEEGTSSANPSTTTATSTSTSTASSSSLTSSSASTSSTSSIVTTSTSTTSYNTTATSISTSTSISSSPSSSSNTSTSSTMTATSEIPTDSPTAADGASSANGRVSGGLGLIIAVGLGALFLC